MACIPGKLHVEQPLNPQEPTVSPKDTLKLDCPTRPKDYMCWHRCAILIMEFYEVIRTRRSVRSYRPDPIPDDKLNRVLDAARIAPSGSNRQPWKFILIKDEDKKKKLVSLCGDQTFVAEAPLLVVACGNNIHYNRGSYMGDMSMLVDVSIAVDHLTLAARAEGLGTCWIGTFDNEAIKRLLHVPEDVNIVALTPLGYPRGEAFKKPSSRKSLSEIVSIDKYDGITWTS